MDFKKRLNTAIEIKVFNYINLCLSSVVSLNSAVKCLSHSGKGLGFPKQKQPNKKIGSCELQASVFSCFVPEFLVQ